jgi:hypothetical protein
MSATGDDLRAAERDEILAHVLEARLDEVDPRNRPYASLAGVDDLGLDRFSADDEGRARWRRDLAARRLDWLEGRWKEHQMRAARRAEASDAARHGIERFAGPGRYSLEDLVQPERERRNANGTQHEKAEHSRAAVRPA